MSTTIHAKPYVIDAPLTNAKAEDIEADFVQVYADVLALSQDLPTDTTIGGAYIYRVGGTDVAMADGGTGASLTASAGAVVYSSSSALALSAVGSSGQLFQSAGTSAPGWTTATYPTTAGTATKVLVSDGTNWVASTPLFSQTPTSGTYFRGDGTNWITSTLVLPNSATAGDTVVATSANTWGAVAAAASGKLYQAAGAGVVPAWTTATFPGTAGAAGTILRSDGTNWVASTPTFSVTPTSGAYFRGDGTNWITSTLILPNSATANYLVYATGSNTWGESSTLTYNGSVLTVSNSAVILAQLTSSSSDATVASWTNSNATRNWSAGVAGGTNLSGVASGAFYVRDETGAATRLTISTAGAVNMPGTVTMGTYTGQSSIVTLGTITSGTWNGSVVGLAYGGTAANLTASHGAVVYSTASALGLSGVGSSGQVLRSAGAGAPVWSTPTFPNSGTSGKVIIGNGTNYVESTPAFPNASATAGKIIRSDGTDWVASTPTFSVTPTSGTYLRGDGTNWITSTLILPNSATANRIAYATGTNTWGDNSGLTYDGDALSVSGTSSKFSSSSAGLMKLTLQTNDTGNTSAPILYFGDASSAMQGYIIWAPSTYIGNASTLAAVSPGSGGVTLQASHASGVLKVLTGGSTEAARVTAAQELLLGTTSVYDEGGKEGKLSVGFSYADNWGLYVNETASTSGAGFIVFGLGSGTGSSGIGSITRVASTSAVAFNTTSDKREKIDHGTRVDLAPLKKLVVHDAEWKTTGAGKASGLRYPMFFAQEAYEAAPFIVTKPDAPNRAWMTHAGDLIPLLVAGWQSHERRLQALEAAA